MEIIRPFLKADLAAYLFSPAMAAREHHARRAQERQTKRTPSELRRGRKQNPRRQPGSRYSVNTFQQAIRRACRRAGVLNWTLLQLRHTRMTEIREYYGVEGAQASAGHRRVETTQIYAEKSEQLARR